MIFGHNSNVLNACEFYGIRENAKIVCRRTELVVSTQIHKFQDPQSLHALSETL